MPQPQRYIIHDLNRSWTACLPWWVWGGSLINHAGSFVIPFFAYYLTSQHHFGPVQVGFVAMLYGAGGVMSTVVAGVAADRLGRRPTLLVSQLVAAATMLGLGFADNTRLIAVLAFVLGCASYAAGPVLSAIIADVVPVDDRKRAYAIHYWAVNLGFAIAPVLAGSAHLQGRYQGLYGMAYALAVVIGPLGGGWLFGHYGGAPVWTACVLVGAACAVGALLIGRGVRHRAAVPQDQPMAAAKRSLNSPADRARS
ncbi:MFS transporter [Streptomyces monashensis]|uniref:MFS transporter n=1 Tax=Streptomyces monashensis TaxID=1678012 RepID=UPI0033F5AA6A